MIPAIDVDDDAVLDMIERRMVEAISSSCNCVTKTPDIAFHKSHCRYRALAEGLGAIQAFRERETARDLDAKGDNLDRGL